LPLATAAILTAPRPFFPFALTNWGRLVPQIVYYVSAYCDLLNTGKIKCGDQINICVPTGNFGNILAAFYAKEMGLPIDRLICASNSNNVLTEFIETGVYNAHRSFYKTLSPSMDILVSSNVERLLFELTRHDGEASARCMKSLAENGGYALSEKTKKELSACFSAGWSDDGETLRQIKESYEKYAYLPDTHTSVALSVLEKYRRKTGDNTITIVAATASPFKFAPDVCFALTGKRLGSGVCCLERLSEITSLPVPEPLKNLESREKRFMSSVEKSDMSSAVLKLLGIS
jgi:threonine synthase